LGNVQKNFGTTNEFFVILGGSIVDIDYDSTAAGVTPATDGVTTTGIGRAGFWFTPLLYAYTEGSVDQRHYSSNSLDSSGYRVVGGIGSDNFGLLKGELFGGYQAEDYSLSLNNFASTVFGGSIY
jgi:Putative beta-barrel porin 2